MAPRSCVDIVGDECWLAVRAARASTSLLVMGPRWVCLGQRQWRQNSAPASWCWQRQHVRRGDRGVINQGHVEPGPFSGNVQCIYGLLSHQVMRYLCSVIFTSLWAEWNTCMRVFAFLIIFKFKVNLEAIIHRLLLTEECCWLWPTYRPQVSGCSCDALMYKLCV